MDERDNLFEIIANYTYDWETWFADDGSVKWINPAIERMTGHGIAECLAMTDYPLALVHPGDRSNIAAILASALSGSSGNDVEFRIRHKSGATGWAAVSWQPVCDSHGRNIGFRTSMRDITERKRAEEALKAAMREAERANKAKSRFLAAVSHDMRQPLQAISMYLGALRRSPAGNGHPDILRDIRLCLDGCNELLDDITDISRLDAGVVVPDFSDFAIADLLEHIETSFRSHAHEKGLGFKVLASSAFVHADPRMLARIVQNLVSNAIRHTPAGRVLVGCRRCDGGVALQVWDTGPGIPEAQREAIFEEFYQIGNDQRDRRLGFGLGLAIVRRQAALMGLQVGVNSTTNKGSMFWVRIPVARTAVPAAVSPRETVVDALPLAGRQLLVIDDEPVQLNAARFFLEGQGAVVEARLSADAAIGCVTEGFRPHLIVADYRLGEGMTGAIAIEMLRAKLGSSIPAIILTGDTEPQRIADADASGCLLLHKPVAPNALIEAIVGRAGAAADSPARQLKRAP